jgi:hypothetical protein
MAKKDTIDALKALGITPDETKSDKVLKAELKAAKVGSTASPNGETAHLGKAERMRRHLEAQPKVPIMIPLTPGEVAGSTESVILNGHRINIRKGEYVHVPEQVARVIMESQQQTEQAIRNHFLMNAEGKSPAMQRKEVSN